MKRYVKQYQDWDALKAQIASEVASGIKNPLTEETPAGYAINDILVQVETRRGMEADSTEDGLMKFYDIHNPEAVYAEVDYNRYYRDVLDLVMFCNSRAEFEQNYSDYLWGLIPY